MDRLLFSFSLTIRFCCICCLRSSLPVHYRSIIFSVWTVLHSLQTHMSFMNFITCEICFRFIWISWIIIFIVFIQMKSHICRISLLCHIWFWPRNLPSHVLLITRREFYTGIRISCRHYGICFIRIGIFVSLPFRLFRLLQMICHPFFNLLLIQELLPIWLFLFSLKHAFSRFYVWICWKIFLIMIFLGQILL